MYYKRLAHEHITPAKGRFRLPKNYLEEIARLERTSFPGPKENPLANINLFLCRQNLSYAAPIDVQLLALDSTLREMDIHKPRLEESLAEFSLAKKITHQLRYDGHVSLLLPKDDKEKIVLSRFPDYPMAGLFIVYNSKEDFEKIVSVSEFNLRIAQEILSIYGI